MEKRTYPFEPGKFGIDLDKLPKTSRIKKTISGSGANLKYLKAKKELYICDEKYEFMTMHAMVDPQGQLTMDLQTKYLSTGEHHPDMFAREFVGYVMQYFPKNGAHISSFRSLWERSENYERFMEVFKETKDPIIAAEQTWTGKVMADHGFTNVTNIIVDLMPEKERVIAIFKKPTK